MAFFFPLRARAWPQLLRACALAGAAAALGAGLISFAGGPLSAALPDAQAKKTAGSGEHGARGTGASAPGGKPSGRKRTRSKRSGGGKGGKPATQAREQSKPQPPKAEPASNLPIATPVAAVPAPAQPESTPATPPAPRADSPSTGSDRTRRAPARDRSPRTSQRRATRGSTARERTPVTPIAARPARRSDEPARKHNSGTRERDRGSTVTRTVRDIVEVLPDSAKVALAALVALSLLLGAGSLLSTLRARRLQRQRSELLDEVGLLQGALLPPVPETLGGLRTSVAYRPADGPGAGGDFYDALALPGGRAAFILGDVSGHGHSALARTAFLRYTLRAYLEAGLEPRVALQVAGRVVDGQLEDDLATVLLAVHDPKTGTLTYASAGHPAPIVVGPSAYEPVLAASSPPLGIGLPTGLRQTTVPLAAGSVVCLHTDGLTEARTDEGILGRGRLRDILAELGRDATADALLERIAAEARLLSDDMATCLLTPTDGVTAGGFRVEQLELSAAEVGSGLADRFLHGCGVDKEDASAAVEKARETAERFGGVVLHVAFGNHVTVESFPRNIQSIESASRGVVAR